MQSDSWYYLLNGQQHGPAAEFEIQTAAISNPGTEILVWQEGMTDWIPFHQAQAQGQQASTFSPPSSALYSPHNNPAAAGPNYAYAHLKTTNGLAITSMILGIVSILGAAFLVIPQILAVIFGHIAIGQIKRDDKQDGTGMAIAGLILGYLCLIIGLLMITFMIFAVRQVDRIHEQHADQIHEELQRLEKEKENQDRFTIPDQE